MAVGASQGGLGALLPETWNCLCGKGAVLAACVCECECVNTQVHAFAGAIISSLFKEICAIVALHERVDSPFVGMLYQCVPTMISICV